MHVKKFIATHYIMEDKQSPEVSGNAKQTSTGNRKDSLEAGMSAQEIAGKFSSVVMAKNLLIDLNYFNFLNPDFDQILNENKVYVLKLPTEKMELFNANRFTILSESIQLLLRFYSKDQQDDAYPDISELPEPKKKQATKKNK